VNEGPAIGYDDDGARVPTCAFDFDALDGQDRQEALAEIVRGTSREAIRRLLLLLIEDADLREAGYRVHVLAYLLRIHPAASQIELAAQLGISQSTVSRCIARTAKNSPVFAAFAESVGVPVHSAADR